MSIPITIIMTFQFCYEEIVSNIKYINIILSPEKYIVNRRRTYDIFVNILFYHSFRNSDSIYTIENGNYRTIDREQQYTCVYVEI